MRGGRRLSVRVEGNPLWRSSRLSGDVHYILLRSALFSISFSEASRRSLSIHNWIWRCVLMWKHRSVHGFSKNNPGHFSRNILGRDCRTIYKIVSVDPPQFEENDPMDSNVPILHSIGSDHRDAAESIPLMKHSRWLFCETTCAIRDSPRRRESEQPRKSMNTYHSSSLPTKRWQNYAG